MDLLQSAPDPYCAETYILQTYQDSVVMTGFEAADGDPRDDRNARFRFSMGRYRLNSLLI